MLAQDNKDIGQAYTLLEVISQDKIKRMAYEARQAELMDQRSRMISCPFLTLQRHFWTSADLAEDLTTGITGDTGKIF